ncbi:MAG: DUF1015 domain-containing protein [Chromatiales bacterium]|nr:DUF1015 domain-containing protein [Chromatiales bacterium]
MPSLIRPFRALRPAPGRAADVIAPPYDVVNAAEARERASGRPWSFLHISRPEIDLPEGTDPYSAEVYAQGAAMLGRMTGEGILARDEQPCYYVWRMQMGSHVQTGLACIASCAAYENNRVRRHEFTRPDKEDDRVRQITALEAQTGPVLLAHRSNPELSTLLEGVTGGEPDCDAVADDDVRHTIWVVGDQKQVARISELVEAMPALYIADGHHRSAAAARVARERQGQPDGGGDDCQYFLAVSFPQEQMQILDYNRVLRDLNGLSMSRFMDRIGEQFVVRPAEGRIRLTRPTQFGMYIGGRWYRLEIRQELIPVHDPVASLDVSLLQEHLLAPVLGIGDPRRDSRIDFVGGIRGHGELERRVDSGEMAVAFALYPTRIDALLAVADAGQVMPPKSTWFEPKLADGLLSHVLD